MTQISGKLYQMKNAAGTENRFPMTVIEGVYGLSTYLQQQFGSLSDIYMPIEGIHEAKTGQEFVYRQTPNTIGANLLNIDRIKGKTLAWNQLVDTTAVFGAYSGTVVKNGNEYIYTATAAYYNMLYLTGWNYLIPNHKYYAALDVKSATEHTVFIAFNTNESYWYFSGETQSDYQRKSLIQTASNSSSNLEYHFTNINVGDTIYIRNPKLIDLTLLGIDNLTTVEEVEAWLATNVGLRSYYPFNAGELKSNDAQSIVTVGKNQWDEEWVNTRFNFDSGEPDTNAKSIGSKNYCRIVPGEAYFVKVSNGSADNNVALFFYDSQKNFISYIISVGGVFTAPANASYFRLYWDQVDSPAIYHNDFCINLSDASFNGQYEPYWKSTLELNIKTLTGKKDGQGASVTIFPDGAGGVGSVYDELRKSVAYKRFGIVDLGNLEWVYDSELQIFVAVIDNYAKTLNIVSARYGKALNMPFQNGDDKVLRVWENAYQSIYIKDSAYSDAATFRAAMAGVKLIYQLATPETYVLDTPLVTTMRAGTTEARISPNFDGISAPFCGDLTYSISAASDALDAQYAARAGQLLNKRKIWGNDFDGTQDVTGLATLGEGAKVSKVFTLPTTPPPAGSVASGEYALYVDPNGNYSQ